LYRRLGRVAASPECARPKHASAERANLPSADASPSGAVDSANARTIAPQYQALPFCSSANRSDLRTAVNRPWIRLLASIVLSDKPMLSRIMTSVALLAVLGAAPLRGSARSCIIYDTPVQKACQPACCAKVCCATAPKKTTPASQPLAKSVATHELSATPAPVIAGGLPTAPERQHVAPVGSAYGGISPPRLALLCTFLI